MIPYRHDLQEPLSVPVRYCPLISHCQLKVNVLLPRFPVVMLELKVLTGNELRVSRHVDGREKKNQPSELLQATKRELASDFRSGEEDSPSFNQSRHSPPPANHS